MVLEAFLAYVMQQLLHLRDLHHSGTAKRRQRIIGELSLTHISAQATRSVVRREAREAHGSSFYLSHTGTEGVLLTHGAGDDLLEVHFHVTKEVLRQIGAMEADSFVGIRSVVVVPVQQSRWRLRSQS